MQSHTIPLRTITPITSIRQKVRLKCLFSNVLLLLVCVLTFTAMPGTLHASAVATPVDPPPEFPVLLRNVSVVDSGQFHYPVLPAVRTSNDGRIGLDIRNQDGSNPRRLVRVYLIDPNALGGVYNDLPGGQHGVIDEFSLLASQLHGNAGGTVRHHALCDGTTLGLTPSARNNPQACTYWDNSSPVDADCYDLTVISSYKNATTTDVEFWGTELTVYVTDPKTPSAVIADIVVGSPTLGASMPFDAFLEPAVTGDGLLLVGRTEKTILPYDSPGGIVAQKTDVVYAVAPVGAAPCDVTQWQTFHAISHAYNDPNMHDGNGNPRYGIAAYPLRDTEGITFDDGEDIEVSYPWIDREGNNLFYTAIDATLFYDDLTTVGMDSRYPQACVPGTTCTDPSSPTDMNTYEASDPTRGMGFVGAWSHGKMVLFDNRINNTDYGLRRRDEDHRVVRLYEPDSSVATSGNHVIDGAVYGTQGAVRVGTGRDNGRDGEPVDAATQNTAFMDSFEHLFNYSGNMAVHTVRDVVWIVNTGKVSAEIAFDDYLDPHGFIVAEMTGSLSQSNDPLKSTSIYNDGFEMLQPDNIGAGFTQDVRIQNAATTPASTWLVPAFGHVQGGARLEPVALGGIVGKGLWLDGSDDRIAFDIPSNQPNAFSTPNWYIGIFVDSRFSDDAVKRLLLSFPDGTKVVLAGRAAIEIWNAAGSSIHTIALPPAAPLPELGWTHLGFVVKNGGADIDFYRDGLLYEQATGLGSALQLVAGGTLYVGADPAVLGTSFRGWIDEFKVLAYEPMIEVLCNHARGSLLAISDLTLVEPRWSTVAAQHPVAQVAVEAALVARNHNTSAYNGYFCWYEYQSTDEASIDIANPPDGTTSLRRDLVFPEGPLHYNAPRPRSTSNPFCTSCHTSGAVLPSLMDTALSRSPGLDMQDDARRQPMQPPPLVFGHIPLSFINGQPSSDQIAPAGGYAIDEWVYP